MYLQQGDTLYFPAIIPSEAMPIKTNVVQEGEFTGHAHRLHDGEFQLFNTNDGTKYLRVAKETEIRHEEHNPFKIPPGDYKIGIVREYNHWENETRQVID